MTSSSQPTCQHLLRFKFQQLVLLQLLVNRFESLKVINVRTNNLYLQFQLQKVLYVLAEKLFDNVLFTRSRVFSTFLQKFGPMCSCSEGLHTSIHIQIRIRLAENLVLCTSLSEAWSTLLEARLLLTQYKTKFPELHDSLESNNQPKGLPFVCKID